MSQSQVTEIRIAPDGCDLWCQEAILVQRLKDDVICITCDDGDGFTFLAGEWPRVRDAVNEIVASIQLAQASQLREDE